MRPRDELITKCPHCGCLLKKLRSQIGLGKFLRCDGCGRWFEYPKFMPPQKSIRDYID